MFEGVGVNDQTGLNPLQDDPDPYKRERTSRTPDTGLPLVGAFDIMPEMFAFAQACVAPSLRGGVWSHFRDLTLGKRQAPGFK